MMNEVGRLLKKFSLSRDLYMRSGYKEQQMRIEFLDPLLGFLGWDVTNSAGHPAPLREVISEDSVEVDGHQKAPDYGFRLGGQRQLFLEAKAPSVGISGKDSALQVRRYGWSAKLPVSILTDFLNFSIYDSRIRPSESDTVETALVHRFNLESMTNEDWDILGKFIRREAIVGGSLAEFARSDPRGKGAIPVDAAFLADLEEWRKRLASHIFRKNPKLSRSDLTSVTQRNLDRLLFLRIAEDRGVEPHGRLLGIANSPNPFSELLQAFSQAEARYNSSLFHFEGSASDADCDSLTASLNIGPRVLRFVIQNMYRPLSPYEFAVFPVELLGQIYEQFLGSEIVITGGQAQVDRKPEVKKAGGVYYTPSDITGMICRNALAAFDAGKAIRARANGNYHFRILDPACGSGSFLLEAYQQLLDQYLLAYTEKSGQYIGRQRPRIIKAANGELKLSIDERQEILLQHCFGADIDHQAVEVTKLSLVLKMLEGESTDTIASQMDLFERRVLPNLSANIVSGNSLVSTDFFDDLYTNDLSDEEILRQNPFDWGVSFPFVAGAGGGFDAIVGNPPYIDSEWMVKHWPVERNYCSNSYAFLSGNWDIYCAFIGRSIELLKKGGYLSFIVPNKLLSADYASATRKFIATSGRLKSLVDFSSVSVFPVSVYPVVFEFEKGGSWGKTAVKKALERVEGSTTYAPPTEVQFKDGGGTWFEETEEFQPAAFEPLAIAASLNDSATVSEAYELHDLISDSSTPGTKDLKVVNSGTIDPQNPLWGRRGMRYLGSNFKYPVLAESAQSKFTTRRIAQGRMRKILVANMTKDLEAFYDERAEYIGAKSVVTIIPRRNPWALCAILNSQRISSLYLLRFGGRRLAGGYIQVAPRSLETLPVPKIILASYEEEAKTILLDIRDLNLKISDAHGQVKIVSQRKLEKRWRDLEALVTKLYAVGDDLSP